MKKEELAVLYELDKNSRLSSSSIAKKTKLSKLKVEKIIKDLRKKSILKDCFPMIEFRDIGYFFGILFIKLRKNVNKDIFFSKLSKIKNNTIIMDVEGEYDAFVAISIKGLNKLNHYIQGFNDKFGKYILQYDSAVANGFFRFFRGYLIGKKEFNHKMEVTGRDKKQYPLDPIDLKIISYLNKDCRIYSNKKIAKLLEMPPEQVKHRIDYLKKEGTLQNFTILLNHKKANIERYRILFKTSGFTKEFEKKFIKFCNLHPNIIHFLRLFGNYDFLIEIEYPKGENSVKKIEEDLKKFIGKKLFKTTSLKILKIYNYRDIIPTLK